MPDPTARLASGFFILSLFFSLATTILSQIINFALVSPGTQGQRHVGPSARLVTLLQGLPLLFFVSSVIAVFVGITAFVYVTFPQSAIPCISAGVCSLILLCGFVTSYWFLPELHSICQLIARVVWQSLRDCPGGCCYYSNACVCGVCAICCDAHVAALCCYPCI